MSPRLQGAALALSLFAAGCGGPGPEQAEPDLIPRPTRLAEWPEARREYERRMRRINALQQTEARPEELGPAFGSLGMLCHANGWLDSAAAAYRNAAALTPSEMRWFYYRGLIHATQGEDQAAQTALERAFELRADFVPTLIRLGEMARERGDLVSAHQRFEAALERQGRSARARAGLGAIALEAGNYKEALAHFQQALDLQPQAEALEYSIGLAYRGLGDREQAREHLRRVATGVRRRPAMHDPVAGALGGLDLRYSRLARRALREGRAEAAAELYRRSIEAHPESASPHINLGVALQSQGRHAEAMRAFAQALVLEPGQPMAHVNLAQYLQGRNPALAEEHYRAALEADPGHAPARVGFAKLLARQERFVEAAEQYARNVALDPGNAALRHNHALCLARAGHYRAALEALEAHRKVLDAAPLRTLEAAILAVAPQVEMRDAARALALARAGFEQRPTIPAAEVVAAVLAAQGDFRRARAWVRAARSVVPAERPALRERLEAAHVLYEASRPLRRVPGDVQPIPEALVAAPQNPWPAGGAPTEDS